MSNMTAKVSLGKSRENLVSKFLGSTVYLRKRCKRMDEKQTSRTRTGESTHNICFSLRFEAEVKQQVMRTSTRPF